LPRTRRPPRHTRNTTTLQGGERDSDATQKMESTNHVI